MCLNKAWWNPFSASIVSVSSPWDCSHGHSDMLSPFKKSSLELLHSLATTHFSFYRNTSQRSLYLLPSVSLISFSFEPTQVRHLLPIWPKPFLPRPAMTLSLLKAAVIGFHLIFYPRSTFSASFTADPVPLIPWPFLPMFHAGFLLPWPLNFGVT